MTRFRRFALVAAVAVGFVPPLRAQPAALTVTHHDGRAVALAGAELAALPRLRGVVEFHGDSVTYEGVDVRGVLRLAGVTEVDSLRGTALRRVLRIVGADGYAAVIALAELDVSVGGRTVVLVDREDGAALPPERGPYRLLVLGDRRASRWVRQVVRLDVLEIAP